MRGAYYNDNSREACATLRVLISEGLIPPGDVDERSIKDVRGGDLRGYVQCHFFAGAGLWAGALRRAGWPDERPVGSGSCPCQGFSLAGKGLGFNDPRHLFPDWLRLIDEARQQGQPWASTLFIEQVASAGEWLDFVQSSMEDRGFAFGYADLPAAGFAQGAHIRQRFYGVADRHNAERWADMAGRHFGDWPQAGRIEGYGQSGAGVATGGMADDRSHQQAKWDAGARNRTASESSGLRDDCGLANDPSDRQQQQQQQPENTGGLAERNRAQGLSSGLDSSLPHGGLGHHHHHHKGPSLGSLCPDERGAIRVEGPAAGASGSLLGCDWLLCHDAKIRPVESGAFPLVVAHPGRLGALRLYGNGLDFETAVNFISAYMEAAEIMELIT